MPQRILVVEDDAAILEVVEEVLRDSGYEVHATTDSRDGLRIAEQVRPDLIVLDMRMPRLDGWQFERELRERSLRVPIVVMTAAQNARQWASEIQAEGYIGKPFNIDELTQEISRTLSSPPRPPSNESRAARVLPPVSPMLQRLFGRPAAPAF
jgi:DNA-binding response OmpR family regulator